MLCFQNTYDPHGVKKEQQNDAEWWVNPFVGGVFFKSFRGSLEFHDFGVVVA